MPGLKYYSEGQYHRYLLKFKVIEAKAREIVPRNSRCSIILQNNLLMCKCLNQLVEDKLEQTEEVWKELASQFATILQNAEVFGKEDSTYEDLVPRLTLVFNCLFWTWINLKGISRNNNAVLESLGLLRKCLHYVLDLFQHPCVNDSFNDLYLSVLHLMSLSTAHILTHPGVHNKLLLEIYLITGHLVLESTQDRCDEEFLQKFTNFVKSLRKFKPLFLSHSERNDSESKLNIFKFGLSKLNVTAHTSDVDLVLDGLGILECLCLLHLHQHETSKAALETLDLKTEISCLSRFLKAYVHMLLGDNEISLLFVQDLFELEMPVILRYHSHLLMGIVLSKTKAYEKAHREFLKAEGLNSEKLCTIVLFHMAINYENWLKDSPSLNEISNAYLCSLKLVIRATQCAIERRQLSPFANYCSKTVLLLEPKPGIVLGRALYMLARNYEITGEFEHSSRTFLKLFRISNCSTKPATTFKTIVDPNPSSLIVLHEAITMLIKSKQFESARIACNVAMKNSILKNAEDELIPYMFLAIIEGKQCNKTQEIKYCQKCLAVASKASQVTEGISLESQMLVKKLLARVYLQKALHYVSIRRFNAATINFKMALGSNICDKRVLYQYFRFLIKSRDMNRFELWISHKNKFTTQEEQYSNLALQYLLESNITDLKIEAMSAHFLASEVFDDF